VRGVGLAANFLNERDLASCEAFFHQRGEACLGFDLKLLCGGDLRQMDTVPIGNLRSEILVVQSA
jgi:hypothetical protein